MDIIGQNGNDGEHYESADEDLNKDDEDELSPGYASSKLKNLKDKLKNTSKANKRGPDGWINIKKEINKIKDKGDDDLVIKY